MGSSQWYKPPSDQRQYEGIGLTPILHAPRPRTHIHHLSHRCWGSHTPLRLMKTNSICLSPTFYVVALADKGTFLALLLLIPIGPADNGPRLSLYLCTSTLVIVMGLHSKDGSKWLTSGLSLACDKEVMEVGKALLALISGPPFDLCRCCC